MKYIIFSHGPIAHGALESLEMIIGKQENVQSLSITHDSTIESACAELESVISKHPNEQWVVFSDIVGGSPFHASYRVLNQSISSNKAMIVTGFNLPLLIEVLVQDKKDIIEIKEIIKRIKDNTISIVDGVFENNGCGTSDDYEL